MRCILAPGMYRVPVTLPRRGEHARVPALSAAGKLRGPFDKLRAGPRARNARREKWGRFGRYNSEEGAVGPVAWVPKRETSLGTHPGCFSVRVTSKGLISQRVKKSEGKTSRQVPGNSKIDNGNWKRQEETACWRRRIGLEGESHVGSYHERGS